MPSSETQGESVGSEETVCRKFSGKGGGAPGFRLSPDHFLTGLRECQLLIVNKKSFVSLCPISEQQISEPVSCVLTWSSTRGLFVCHIALLACRKSKALFMENLTVNAPRSLRTRRKYVTNQFTGRFVLI